MEKWKKIRNRRGSALILVILVTLVLSAFAIVALRNVSRSVQQASVYKTRNQAQLTSWSAVDIYTQRAGDRASTIVNAIQQKAFGEGGGNEGVFGGVTQAERVDTATRGGYLLLTDDELKAVLPFSDQPMGGNNQTGLFTNNPGSNRSFELAKPGEFRIIVRDLVDGIPAPGYSGRYCFKKATIASEATVGEPDPDWTKSNNVATTRHGKEVLLGPMECGYE